jgi:hypothetical protein
LYAGNSHPHVIEFARANAMSLEEFARSIGSINFEAF